MRSIEITVIRGRDVRCVADSKCSIAMEGEVCDRPAGLAFDLGGGRLVPACAFHVAAGIGKGGIAVAGGNR